MSFSELMEFPEVEETPLINLTSDGEVIKEKEDYDANVSDNGNIDLLSIVLEETDKENKVKSSMSDEDDIFGIKEILLQKEVELGQKAKKDVSDKKNKSNKFEKGKMTSEDLSSIVRRKVQNVLDNSDMSGRIDKGLLQAGLNRIWEIDAEYQNEILRGFMKDIRNIPSDYLDSYIERMRSIGSFFNPNDEYMKEVFGKEIMQPRYGIYESDESNKFCMRLMMPLRFFDGSVVGFVGYSPVENEEGRTIKYLYPRKEILEKSRILATEVDVFKKAIKDGYICLTDGYFDAFSLNVYGINAASLCGSALTEYHKLFLDKIKVKIIIPDNDKAGTKLEKKIKSVWRNSRAIHQSVTKDIDEYLSDSSRIKNFVEKFNWWRNIGFLGDLKL